MPTDEEIQFTHDIDPMAVAAFFVRADQLREDPDVTPMKLQKLLYLAQANYLASTNERLFDSDIEAFEHGPVVHRVWREFYGRQIISPELHAQVLTATLPRDTEEFLEQVWAKYQDMTANALRRLTHEQAPWKDHYVEGVAHIPIPDDDMKAYFSQKVPAKERVFHPNVVIVPPQVLDDDAEADARLQAFLSA